MKGIIKTILLVVPFLALAVNAKTAMICLKCQNPVQAQAAAIEQANFAQCIHGLHCDTGSKEVTLVDFKTEELYKFNLYREKVSPWKTRVETVAIGPDESYALTSLIKFYKALQSTIRDASDNSSSNFAANYNANSVIASCPQNTALVTLLDPNKLRELSSLATLAIASDLASKSDQYHLNAKTDGNTATLSYKGIGYSINLDERSNSLTAGIAGIPAFTQTFTESERKTPLNDYLAFNVSIIGYSDKNLPLVNFTLNDAARVGGYSLAGLKATHGPLLIDNDCIKNHFAKAVRSGIFTSKHIPLTGAGLNANAPSQAGNCRVSDFYHSGLKVYSFRECE